MLLRQMCYNAHMGRPNKYDYKKMRKQYFDLVSSEAKLGRVITQKRICLQLEIPVRTMQQILKNLE